MISVRLLCVAAAITTLAAPARAQVAAVPYWTPGGFGFGSGAVPSGVNEKTTFYGTVDEDGFRKGLSFSTYSIPTTAFASGLNYAGLGTSVGAFGSSGLALDGARYGYSFRSVGDMPVTLFGGVNSLRTTQDVFTSLVTPGFETSRTLATSVTAGIEFKPTSNLSLSLSANVVQAAPTQAADLRSQLIQGYR